MFGLAAAEGSLESSDGQRALPWILLGNVLGCLSALLGPSFDGTHTILTAVRVLSGQRIYEDFAVPHGPVATWILVPFLAIAPSIGWGFVLASGALNALAVGAAWRIAVDSGAGLAAARSAAILTGVWFVPVFGGYYPDHLAYAWVLVAFALYLSRLPSVARGAAAGLLLALAYHTKQPVGGAALLALAAAAWVVDGRRVVRDRVTVWLLLFLAIGHTAVVGIVALTGTLSDYYTYAVRLPAEYAVAAATKRPSWWLLEALILPFRVDPFAMVLKHGWGRLLFYPAVIAVYASYVWLAQLHRASKRGDLRARRLLMAGLLLVLSTLWCSVLLGRLHSHVTFGLWALVALLSAQWAPIVRNGIVAFSVVLGLIHVGVVHRPWPPFRSVLTASQLRPMLAHDAAGSVDLDGARLAIEYLRGQEGGIALFSDSAQIIPLALARPTFEPVSYYAEGLSVPTDAERRRLWERCFETVLESRRVRFLLWNPGRSPRVRGLDLHRSGLEPIVAARFARPRSFGSFLLFERRD